MRPPREKKRKGLVIVFTGDGKGKSTAAIGMALRATGHHMRVHVIQFIKGRWKSGEVEAAKRLLPDLTIERAGLGFTIERLRDPRIPMDDHRAAAQAGIVEAREAVASGGYAIVVLDEILGAIAAGLVTLEQVVSLVDAKPPGLHLVLTGRNAPPQIVERADLVTEMRLVKHPYEQGIVAQRGVEF
ncbi:MAG: cob(I)yrinic acid a,c-diamide adenosyltransferase [Chloroflexota bacterium]|nr:cob(I)yrinic acid a,c-diamide adenosyltransferase [Chloroflexota bacterium]MDE3101256.1 cob(I)yrinic acid a,c-diamide adenosyltransferase [Chloroflexota bacterium]